MRRDFIFALILAFAGSVLGSLDAAAAPCTLPYQLTNGQTADATQVMANFNALLACLNNLGPGGSPNAVQYNAGAGSFGGLGPLTNGQLAVGASGGPPQATTLTGGTGIAITNGPGSITIAGSGSGGSSGSDAPFTAPVLANLTWMQQGGASAVQDGTYVDFYNPVSNAAYAALMLPVSATSFTITTRIRPSLIAVNYQVQGIVLASSALTGGKLEMSTAIFTSQLSNEQSYWDVGWAYDHSSRTVITYADAIWLRVVSTSSGNSFYVSQNGRVWTQTASDSNSWIGAPIAYAGIMCGGQGGNDDTNITINSLQITYP